MALDAIETMLIERACARLVSEYCHLVDHGQASKVADLFTDDGFWSSPETALNGRAEIERGFGRREQNRRRMSRHICSNLLIEVLDETTARGVVYLTLYRHDGEEGLPASPVGLPAFIGEYRDEFQKTAEGWRFKRRETRANV
jgi:ketosteroid isomerase-like protein